MRGARMCISLASEESESERIRGEMGANAAGRSAVRIGIPGVTNTSHFKTGDAELIVGRASVCVFLLVSIGGFPYPR